MGTKEGDENKETIANIVNVLIDLKKF